MSKTCLFAAAALLSALIGPPASAQHMIDEPGMYAFYHPDGDLGIASPRTLDAQAMAPRIMMRRAVAVHPRLKMRK
jgi:hypothetical protein